MRTSVLTAVWFSAMVAAGCSNATAPDTTATVVPLVRLGSQPFAFENNSDFPNAEREVIRDVAAWSRAWASIYKNKGTKPPLPDIDFTKEMIVLVALGARPTGGYDILLTGATRDSDAITVTLESTSPGSGCGVTLSMTHPVDVARIPRSTTYVQFSEKAIVRNCR